MRLLIRHVRWHSEGRTQEGAIRIRGSRIAETGRDLPPGRGEGVLDAAGLLALPGLINGHDHLELNLFPRTGSPPYPDAYAWGRDIHHPDRSPLREILRVELRDRLWWGAYRNLLGGATTVMHHNPYHSRVFGRRFPVRVLRHCAWAHSLGHGDDIAAAFARSRGRPFVIHALEGINRRAAGEWDRLEAEGVIAPNTVLVHAVALGNGQVERLVASGAAVVWCPTSNCFLFGRTAPVAALMGRVRVCLGTDSTLSGPATLLDEAREAARSPGIEPAHVLELLTTGAAAVFGIRDGRGTLREGAPADLILIPDRDGGPAESLLDARSRDLALVMVRGRPRLARPGVAEALALGEPNARVEGEPRWLYGRLASLKASIERAAGAEVLAGNPVWSLLEPGPVTTVARPVGLGVAP